MLRRRDVNTALRPGQIRMGECVRAEPLVHEPPSTSTWRWF